MVQPWQDLGERGLSVAQSSEQAPFISEIVGSRYGLMRWVFNILLQKHEHYGITGVVWTQLAKVQNLGLFYFCYILTSKIPLVFLIFTYLLMIQICFTLIRVYWHWKPLVTNKFHMFTNGYVQTSHHSIEKSNYTIFQPVQKKVNYQMKVSLNGHLLKQDFSKVSIKIKWNIGAISHRWIFIFFTGVVPETLGGEQVRQDKASLNPREAYTLGVDCGATRGRLESRKQSTPTPRSVQKVVLCKKMNQRVTLHKLILWLNYTNIL
jgi:hypothetical protein